MPNWLKLLSAGFGLHLAGWILVLAASFVAAVVAGPTMRGGQRAVMFLLYFDIGVGLAVTAVLARLGWFWTTGWHRWLVAAGSLVAWAAVFVMVFFTTLVIFNR